MSHSNNPRIQKLIDEVEALDPADLNIEQKLALIAEKVAAEQQAMKAKLTGIVTPQITDPADAFACEGCQ